MVVKVATIVGARPQFIKAAAVSRAVAKDPRLVESIIHTGQHFDANMSDVFFEELKIPAPSRHLGVSGGRHGAMTGQMLALIEAALVEDRPDVVLVYGDTNSTIAGALAAAKLHFPVVHSEAGLRSFNRRMPEEVNRVLTDHMSTLLLCPTHVAVENLAREGVVAGVKHVGDVMFDATLFAISQQSVRSQVVNRLDLSGRKFAVCTLHRAENTEDPARLNAVLDYLDAHASRIPIVFPVHPRTRGVLQGMDRSLANFIITDPLGYFDIHQLLASCEYVLTDSGGLQKEAYFHRKPCITLRDETEWVETIEAGWNRLWTQEAWSEPRTEISDYGRGNAAELTVEAIAELSS